MNVLPIGYRRNEYKKRTTHLARISQVHHVVGGSVILACAPENSAADQLAERLLAHIDKGKLFRMYASSRPWAFIPQTLKVLRNIPRDRSLPAQPISIRKAQSRKKAHKPLRTSWISPKTCLPCLIIINLVVLTLDLRFLLCSLELDVLRAQRIMGFKKILITHKSKKSENSITW